MKLHWISPSFPSRGVKRNWRMFLSKTTIILNPERQKLVGSEDDWHLPRHKVLSTRPLYFMWRRRCWGGRNVFACFTPVNQTYELDRSSAKVGNYACILDLNFTRKVAASRTFQGNRNRSRIYLGNSSFCRLDLLEYPKVTKFNVSKGCPPPNKNK